MALVLEIITKADKATKGIAALNSKIKGIQTTGVGATNSLTGSFARLAGGIGIGAAVISAISLGKQFVSLASAATEVSNKFNVVFQGVGGTATAIQKLSRETRAAASTVQEATASFGDLIKPLGFAADEAFDMSTKLFRLTADLSSFNDVAQTEVIDAFKSALSGTSVPLTRFGINVREGAIAVEAMNLGLVKSETEYRTLNAITKQNVRTQALISRAFKDSKDAIGDLGRTMDTHANQARQFDEAWKEFGERIGKVLIPTITKALTEVNKELRAINQLLGVETEVERLAAQEKTIDLAKNYLRILDLIETESAELLKAQEGNLDVQKLIVQRRTDEIVTVFKQISGEKRLTQEIENRTGALFANRQALEDVVKSIEKEHKLLGGVAVAPALPGVPAAEPDDKAAKRALELAEAALEVRRLALVEGRREINDQNIWEEETEKVHNELMLGMEEEFFDEMSEFHQQRISNAEETAAKESEIRKIRDAELTASAELLSNLTQSAIGESKTAVFAFKTFAIAETLISTYAAAQKQFEKMTEINPLLAWAASAAAVTAGLAKVAKIAGVGFAEGGLITGGVRGNFGRDNTLIAAKTGEFVIQEQAVTPNTLPVLDAINQTGVAPGGTMNVSLNVIDQELISDNMIRNLTERIREQLKMGELGFA